MSISRFNFNGGALINDPHGSLVRYSDHREKLAQFVAAHNIDRETIADLRAQLARVQPTTAPIPQGNGVFYTDPELLRNYLDAVVFVEFHNGSCIVYPAATILSLADLSTIKRWRFQ